MLSDSYFNRKVCCSSSFKTISVLIVKIETIIISIGNTTVREELMNNTTRI